MPVQVSLLLQRPEQRQLRLQRLLPPTTVTEAHVGEDRRYDLLHGQFPFARW
jgi:hypothetical protein